MALPRLILAISFNLYDSFAYSLRSSKHAHLQYTPGPRTYTRYGDRAFSVAAPKLWNGLPISIRNATSIECFKSNLKRFLFNSPN